VLFLAYLDELRVVRRIFASTHGIGLLQKPDKILLHHPNLQFALADEDADKGSSRESFFVNQVGYEHEVSYSKTGDFRVDDRVFEIGGRNMSTQQIRGLEQAYIVHDDLEIGTGNRIPLWVFGFLY
jgi:hypothetical protein